MSDKMLHENARSLVSQLSSHEREVAARASYSYLCNHLSEQDQFEHAERFASRFLRAPNKDMDKALKRVKATLAFRQEINVDGLRRAFDHDDIDHDINKNTVPLQEQLKHKSTYVQGYDREGRSTVVFVTRNDTHHDEEWTLRSHVYTVERALACSKASDGTCNAIIDFNGFSMRHAPPMSIAKPFLAALRNHYAGAIHQIYIVDAPLAFYALWNIVKPFIGTKTRDKIQFVTSSSKTNCLIDLYDKDQLAPWMAEGYGTNNRDLDVDEYLHQTPFDCAYGEAISPERQ